MPGGSTPGWLSTLPEYLVAFTPGLALAVVEQRWAARLRGSRRAVAAAWAAVAIGVAVAVARSWLPAGASVLHTVGGTLTGGFVVAGALLRQWSGRPAWGVLAHPVSAWIGERSYGLYLVHLLVLRQIAPLADRFASPRVALIVVVAVLLPLSLVAAAILWRVVERPAMELGRRRRAPAAVPAPQAS